MVKIDYLERVSRIATIIGFVIAVFVAFTAPLMALSWRKRPFPGFLVEQTLVVNNISQADWSGKAAGIGFPQQVIRIAGVEVKTAGEFDAVLNRQEIGDEVAVMTRLQNGKVQLYPSVLLTSFPTSALVKNFWVLYGIGLVYLGIGVWVYLVRGKSRTGRALSFFCITTSLGTILIFDLSSTHFAVPLWSSSVALAAGSLVSLGMRFPVEWHIVKRYPWMLALPYLISILLSLWGIMTAYNMGNPWSYIANWETTYRFAALSILVFLGLSLYHAASSGSYRVRQQSRIMLLGSAVAFIPVAFMFIASRRIGFHVFLLMLLPAFPISVAVAVMRYNLWKVDTLVNRAIVYGILTTFLVGIFSALGELLETIFITTTGESSNIAIIITAFFVAATVKPIQNWIGKFVTRRLGSSADNTKNLKEYGEQIESYLFFNDPDQITTRLLEEVAHSLNAESCAIIASDQGSHEITHVYGPWRGKALASVPLAYRDRHFGMLFLGPNAAGTHYSLGDFSVLEEVVERAAKAIYISSHLAPFQSKAKQ